MKAMEALIVANLLPGFQVRDKWPGNLFYKSVEEQLIK